MTKETIITHDRDTSSSRREDRELELSDWDREKSLELAKEEGIELTDMHWAVIEFLRNRYIEKGEAEHAREVSDDLNMAFAESVGEKQLRKLFPGGPITQGCRIAGLQVPAYSRDPSFGTTF